MHEAAFSRALQQAADTGRLGSPNSEIHRPCPFSFTKQASPLQALRRHPGLAVVAAARSRQPRLPLQPRLRWAQCLARSPPQDASHPAPLTTTFQCVQMTLESCCSAPRETAPLRPPPPLEGCSRMGWPRPLLRAHPRRPASAPRLSKLPAKAPRCSAGSRCARWRLLKVKSGCAAAGWSGDGELDDKVPLQTGQASSPSQSAPLAFQQA